MKRTVPLILVIPILLSLLPGPLPVAAARPGEASLETAADSKGCAVTLLKNRDYFSALCEKIRDARRQIVLAFFLFRTNGRPNSYPEILLAELGRAARRGVPVTVVLEQDDRSGSTVNRDNRDVAERLKQAGVEIHFDAPKRTTHAKIAVIDRRYCFIGSHNLTASALRYNNELSVLIDSPALADSVLDYIRGLY
ncbi:MAG: putative cardiolipin synthase YbhO [Syntrophaceae bacterium PtaB.Bin095]|nr:MAG: putative cardiolipin synthase YbhO [Syntrophaceae bacterium PtaB.Bin095]